MKAIQSPVIVPKVKIFEPRAARRQILGNARHWQPVLRMYIRPFTTSRTSTLRLRPPLLAGGISGALLLLATGDALFSAIVPWLMLVALGVFIAGPWLKKATARITISRWAAVPAVYLTCVYGGYFNGGVGIIMIAVLGLLGQTRLMTSVAMKAVMSATLTLISVSTYAAFGLVQWPIAGLMALGAITGGWGGAALGHVIAPKWHRAAIIVIAAAMTLALFMRGAG